MDMKPIYEMIGRMVKVTACDVVYRGILVELSEEAIELQGETQWITIPVEKINSVVLEEATRGL